MKDVDLETGTVVPHSLGKTLVKAVLAAFVLFAGFGILVVGLYLAATNLGLAGPMSPPAWRLPNVLLGLLVAVVGAAVGLLGGAFLVGNVLGLVYKWHFIIGKTCLQLVQNETNVTMQIPFDNVRTIRLKSRRTPNSAIPYIAIDLDDSNRTDTFVSSGFDGRQTYDCDVFLLDYYEMPLEEFYRKLRGKVKQAAGDG